MLAVLLATASIAHAQAFDPLHRSAIELNAGFAPVQALLRTYDGQSDLTPERFFSPAANLSYVFQINDSWGFQGSVNMSGNCYKLLEDDGTVAGRELANLSPTFVLALRYYWMRKENCTMYSSFGVGLNPEILLASFCPTPIPSIAPFGIVFGKGRIYGLSELIVGSAATGVVIGVGCHL